jgi:predicted DsbA family dithiol-disulfide isomerase
MAEPEVVVVEFLNPFCPHCRTTHARLERVLPTVAARVRRYRVYVWSSAEPPLWARACACAAARGKEDALFEELTRAPRDTPDAVWAAARRVGLDAGALAGCLGCAQTATRLDGERQRVLASSIRHLPTLDVGRRRLEGEQTEGELRAAIEAGSRLHAAESGRAPARSAVDTAAATGPTGR